MDDHSFYKQSTIPHLTSEELQAPPLPEKIGPYKIEGLLSKGGMSFLYLGVLPETKETLAVKVLSPKYVTHPEAVEHFLKEAQIIALTNHPNIVKLYGQGAWEGGLFIAMELIQGVSLRQFIMQQSLSLRRSLDIILQVAYALCHLHTHGVIHRDLKPENILITEDGEIKVIDFGIAQLHEEKEAPLEKRFMGTPSYMSPEQKEHPLKLSYSSDIYSLGIITYELVLGKLSYGIINTSLLPKELRKIVEKALAPSPQDRYQDIVDFITDISLYLKSDELTKTVPGSDQIKELTDRLHKSCLSLSPATLPAWPDLDIGIGKYRGPNGQMPYYDFFQFPDSSYGFLIAEATTPGVESALYTAAIRGVLRGFVHDVKLSFLSWASRLQEILSEDHLHQSFNLNLLLLDPIRDELSFISCGGSSLWHLRPGSTPRQLSSENPLLSERPGLEFSEVKDTWSEGDTIFLPSFCLLDPTQRQQLENEFLKEISGHILLSPQNQAESVLKRVSSSGILPPHFYPKLLFSIQRLD